MKFLILYESSVISYFMLKLRMFKSSYQHLKIENTSLELKLYCFKLSFKQESECWTKSGACDVFCPQGD